MNKKSIEGYARAERYLYDTLLDSGVNMPEDIFDHAAENPPRGLAELMQLVNRNHLMDDNLKRVVGEALDDVDPDETGPLTIEEQGDYILAWFHAERDEPKTLTVPEAAAELGITLHGVRRVIETDPDKVGPGKILGFKPRGRWLLDKESFDEYKAWRESR